MNKEQIKGWLPLVGGKPAVDQSRGGWVLSSCPLGPWKHDNGKSNPTAFAVRLEAGDSFCNCFSCGYHGTQSNVVTEISFLNKKQPSGQKLSLGEALQLIALAEDGIELELDSPDIEQMLFHKQKPHIYPEDWLSSFKPALSMQWSRDYMQSRGVPTQIAEALDIRADSGQQRLCMPIRDFQGRLRGLHGRAVDKAVEPRYRMYPYKNKTNPEIWLGEHYVEFDRPIVVVEGFLDLTSVARVYRNVVSPLFANPSFTKLDRMSDALEWVTALDNGKGGDAGRVRISQHFPHHIITHLKPPLGTDPNTMSLGEMIKMLEPHVELEETIK